MAGRKDFVLRGTGITIVAGVLATGAYIVGTGDGGGEFPSTTAANVFIDDSGSDAGANCVRFSTPQSTPPTASTVCRTGSKAYEIANAGDTVWVLPGTYTDGSLTFATGTPPTDKTVSDDNDCRTSNQCVYYLPQPGQAANVNTRDLEFKATHTPEHLYYKGFIRGACASFSPVNFTDGDGNEQGVHDVTVDALKALRADTDCVPYIAGPRSYVRILNSEFEHHCVNGDAGGFQIQGTQSGLSGEATDHAWAPSHILIEGSTFRHYQVNCTDVDHQDCIHIYAMTESTIRGNTFADCWDSSILAGGLDEAGFAENNIIENNWFGSTQLGVNNCCLRGDSGSPSAETFDNWIIRFNSSVSYFNNKPSNVLNNVSFIGNVGLGEQVCRSGTGLVWKYNVYNGPSSPCDASDNPGETNSTIKFTDTSSATLNLHVASDSVVVGFVPGAQSQGCSAVATDFDGAARGDPCDAGSDETP